MPCNKELDCLLPRCQTIEEIWPAIISKAIIKLFSYKFKLQTNPNCIIGDIQIIHSITGYYGSVIDIHDKNTDMEKYIKKVELKSINERRNSLEIITNSHFKDLSDKDSEYEKNYFLFFNNNPKEIKDEENFPNRNLYLDSKNVSTKTLIEESNGLITNKSKVKDSSVPNFLKKNTITSKDTSIHDFLNSKKKGSITSKILPIAPLEPIKLTQIANEKTNEVLLRKSSMERSINNKIISIRRSTEMQKFLMEDENYKSPINRPSTFAIGYSNSLKAVKKASKMDLGKISNNNEEINNTLKRASLFPQQSLSDLNKLFTAQGNESLLDFITKDYEDMNNLLKKSRKMTMSNSKKTNKLLTNLAKDNSHNSKIVSRENSSKKGKNFKFFKRANNAMYGMFYPCIEVFNTNGFNKIRFNSIDVNELKDILMDLKFAYKKASKEEKKDFVEKIVEIETSYTEKKNKKVREMQEASRNSFLMKVSNNCNESPQLKFYCSFSDEEIEIILNCFINSVNFPPFAYYKNLADMVKNNVRIPSRRKSIISSSIKNMLVIEESSLANKVLSPIRERDFSNLKNSNNKKNNIDSSNFLLNGNEIETERKVSNNELVGTKSQIEAKIAKNNKSFFTLYDEVHRMTTDEYLMEIFKEMIACPIEKYEKLKKIKRKNIKGQWINLDEMKKEFDYFMMIFKDERLKVRSNINTNIYSTLDKFNKTDEQQKVYLISLIDIPEKLPEISEIITSPIENKKNPPGKNNNNKKSINDPKDKKNDPKDKKNNQKNNLINFESELLSPIVEKKVEKIIPKSINQPILIEFCPNNGKVGDLEDINNFIVFDIYEINTNLNEIENDNIEDPEYEKIQFRRRSVQKTPMKTNSIFFNGKIKLIFEDIQLKGFYSIFYKDVFEREKTYMLFVKSSFAPFGYNLKILTQMGSVETMSYDKYLMNYGGMKLIKNLTTNLPHSESNMKFLAAKFLLKFANPENCESMEEFKENLRKNFFEIKVNINCSDNFLTQFFSLVLSKISKGDLLPEKSEDKIFPLNEIFYLNLNMFNLTDEIIVIFF